MSRRGFEIAPWQLRWSGLDLDALHRTELQRDYYHVHLLLATIAHEFGDRASNRDVRMDGGNAADQRVSVTVTTTYQPSITFIFANTTYSLSATSIMPIAH